MGGLLMVKAAAYGWLGGLIAAPFLWLPALGVSVWILVREPRSRAVLLPLAAAWGLCLPLLWHMMAGDRISTLRNWIVTGPVYLLAALSIALLIGTAWYAMRQMDRRWKKRLLEVGAALYLASGLVLFLLFYFWLQAGGERGVVVVQLMCALLACAVWLLLAGS